jgi:Uma2 family endonuclease
VDSVRSGTENDEIEEPDISHLITEDDEPVDNPFSEKQQRLLVDSLYSSWSEEQRSGRPFVAFANVGLFFVPKNPALVPDVQVSLDVTLPKDLWEKKARSYMTWVYGKPPDIVIEIVSNKKGGETKKKFKTYAEQGVGYYIIYDPQKLYGKRSLRAYVLHGRAYLDLLEPGWLEDSHLGLRVWDGIYEEYDACWLRWCDSSGELLKTSQELAAHESHRAEQASQRAEQESQRAEQESQRAEQESQRAEQESQRAEQESQRAVQEAQKAALETERADREALRARAAEQELERLKARLKERDV